VGLTLLFLYLPLAVVVVHAFNANPDQVTVWTGTTTAWFPAVLRDDGVLAAVATSLRIAAANAVGAMLIGTLAAVGLRHAPRWLRAGFDALAYLTLLTPVVVIGIASLVAFVLAGIPRGSLTVLAAHVVVNSSIVLLVVRARLAGLGGEQEEAAADLGAGRLATFAQVTLPRLAPAVVAGGLLAFTYSWDDYVIASFVAGPSTTTLPVRIFSELRFGVSPQLNALATLTLAVTAVGLSCALLLLGRTLRPAPGPR
jgi:ABC-type spermidine/putrescine transport system permease subunit II